MILFQLNLWRTVWTKIHESFFKLIFKEKPPGVFFFLTLIILRYQLQKLVVEKLQEFHIFSLKMNFLRI